MKCTECKAEFSEDLDYCKKCGSPLIEGKIEFGERDGKKGLLVGGQKGIFFGAEKFSRSWRIRAYLLDENGKTGLYNVSKIEDLVSPYKHPTIRKVFKKKFSNHGEIIERIVLVLQDKTPDFVSGEEEEKEAEEEGIKYSAFEELSDGSLAEQGYDGNKVYFLVYDPKTDKVMKKEDIATSNYILRPIDNDEVRMNTVLLPGNAVEYGTEEELAAEILKYLNKWHEAPDELSRKLDVFYCFLSYIKDLIPQLPYRRYLAPWGKGKSAWLETLGWICYRGLILAGSDTDKSVVRKMNNWKGTGLIDEADFGMSNFYAFLVKILNIGYDQKTGFYQRCDDDDPNKILTYWVYGPKLLATRSRYQDMALESRCITTTGRQNSCPMPLFRMGEFMKEAQALRNKLIMWRFRKYHPTKVLAKELEKPIVAEKIYGKSKDLSSRVKQVLLPLWLIGGMEMKDTLVELAQEFNRMLQTEDPDYLLEIQAKEAARNIVEDYLNIQNSEVHVTQIPEVLPKGEVPDAYFMKLTDLSERILTNNGRNSDRISHPEKISTSKKIKRILEVNLGFPVKIGIKRVRMVRIPSNWIDEEGTLYGAAAETRAGLEEFLGKS